MADVTRDLHGQRVAFTGRLAALSRAQAREVVLARGGIPERGVTRRTSLLVVGMAGWPLLPDGTVSAKLRRAEALRSEGLPIRILPETGFLEAAGLTPGQPDACKHLTLNDVSGALGVDPETVRRWEHYGLIRPFDGRYDFLDLASLQTLVALVGRGVRTEVIATSLWQLRRVLPDVQRPLAQLSLVAEHAQQLLVRSAVGLADVRGQMVFEFEPAHAGDGRAPLALRVRESLSADEWLDRGERLEEAEQYEAAAEAYRRAVGLAGHLPAALFNLGNVLRAMNRSEAAEEAWRLCLAQDDQMACAWYNLADLQEEHGRTQEAITSLEAALRSAPGYADAHFNLAAYLQMAGRASEAAGHWSAYLAMDSSSEWARLARERLRACTA